MHDNTDWTKQICAGGLSDACNGDSGGPLLILDKGKPVLAGIISYGIECGSSEYFCFFILSKIKLE